MINDNSWLEVVYKYSVDDAFFDGVESVTVYESKKIVQVCKSSGTIHIDLSSVASLETNEIKITYLP